MAYGTSTCFAGRIVIRHDRLGGLDWALPCVVPAENELPTAVPMWFCSPHFKVAMSDLYAAPGEARSERG